MSAAAKIIPLPVRAPARRQWAAAKGGPLHADWLAYTRPIDVDIRHALPTIRARARELAQNSDHAKGYLRIVGNNIVGPHGYVLQSRAAMANGKPDLRMREQLESEWRAWCQRGHCEVSGKFSWSSLQRHLIKTVARDGEALVRILDWPDNRWGMTLQVIDPETLDIEYNGEYQGRQVRMGVEIDDYRRPVAYHLLGEPTIHQSSYRSVAKRYRVPAAEILHLFDPEFCWQTRGVSWLAVAAGRLHMIQGTEDAEVTASRASAAKFAAYEAREWAPPPQPDQTGLVDANGDPLSTDQGRFAQDIAPGTMEVVPYGYELKMLDPQHPNAAMPDFLKWALRSVATGMGVSYNTLGNDAEGVNYTSLRFFLGVERDHWRECQDWFESEFPEPVRKRWTERQRHNGTLVSRPGRDAQWDAVYWQPRRWEGPDPAKQSAADEGDLKIGAATLTEILARKGRDFEDVVTERVRELARIKEIAEQNGLTLAEVLPALAAKPAPADPPPSDPNETQPPID